MHRILSALRSLAAALARLVLAKEPVLTGGVLAGVALGAAAWFGFTPSSQAQQVVQTVCGVLAPLVAAVLARLAAWSPASHASAVVAAQATVASNYTVAQGFPAAMVSVSTPAAANVPLLNGRLDPLPTLTTTGIADPDPTGLDPVPESTPEEPKPQKKPPAKKATAKKPAAKKKGS